MDKIQQLTQLNVEIEGLLHVLSNRDNVDLRRLLSEKFNLFSHIFTELLSDGELDSQTADAEEAVLKEAAETLSQDEVKDQEAESSQIEDENEAAVEAIDKNNEKSFISDTFTSDLSEGDEDIIPVELGEFPDSDDAPNDENDDFVDQSETQSTEHTPKSVEDINEDNEAITEQSEEIIRSLSKTEHQTVGDRLTEDMPSEIRVDEMIARKTAGDLSKAFTLNDKLRFRRTLFASDADKFAHTLNILSSLESYSAAVNYLTSTYDWNPSNDEVVEFLSIIRPHYPKED